MPHNIYAEGANCTYIYMYGHIPVSKGTFSSEDVVANMQ